MNTNEQKKEEKSYENLGNIDNISKCINIYTTSSNVNRKFSKKEI